MAIGVKSSVCDEAVIDSEDFLVRPYRAGDEREIVRLLDLPFDDEVALQHWRWKLMHWPTAVANVWLADIDGNAVFHYAGIPLRFQVDGETRMAMISVDVRTSPEHRRRGLLTRGAGRAFSEWASQGVAFTLGLPNEQWGSRLAATGCRELFPLAWMVRPLRPEALAARRLGLAGLRNATAVSAFWRRLFRDRPRRASRLSFRECSTACREFDDIWDQCRANAAYSTVRDSAWVQWRFLSSPTKKYRVILAEHDGRAVGYYAWRDIDADRPSAYLAEFVGIENEDSILEGLLADAVARADGAGADMLATLAVPGTKTCNLLSRSGFFRGPAFTVYLAPFARDLSLARLRDPGNWNLSPADFDVI